LNVDLSKEIVFNHRLEWFVYELVQNDSLKKEREEFQVICIEHYRAETEITE